MAYELIKVSELPELTTPSDPNVIPIQDGDYLKRISFQNLKEAVVGAVETALEQETEAREQAISEEAQARENADDAIMANLAPEYDATVTYAVGDYAVYEGRLYRCTTAIETAEAWTASHWTAVAMGDEVGDLKNALDEITSNETISEQVTEYYTTPWTSGGGINIRGDFVSVDSSWAYTNKIAVQVGDVVTCDAIEGGSRVSRPIRMLCAYNNGSPVSASGSSTEISGYTVPDGVTHIVVTQASFTYYIGQRVVINRATASTTIWLKQNKIGGFLQHGSLNDGDEFAFPITNIKQYKVFTFDGNITSFSSIVLGRYGDNADKESVTVDGTNITIKNTYGAETVIAHGLTIADNIQVLLKTGNNNRLSAIRVTSKGNTFEYTTLSNITWNADKGYPFVRSVGSVLTNCSASWTSRKINAPIWIFGDSYMTYDSARWAYYLIQDGYDESCLMNAYAGENSQNALIAFESLMTGNIRPKIIVWALGMNDGDSESDDAPNGNWLNVLNTVKSFCESRNIELVLCTIPTTPLINNNYKNAWIKTSGYRYIDFAAGVGATSSGVWFDGLLSSDNVHPTAEGAKTLYYKLLSDFPEIVVNN